MIHHEGTVADLDQVMLAVIRACAEGATTADIIQAIGRSHHRCDRIVILHSGDEAVGIVGESACVEMDLRAYPAPERARMLEEAQVVLIEAFSQLWDTRAEAFVADETDYIQSEG